MKERRQLPATASLDYHLLVVLEHYVLIVVHIKHRHRTELGRHAAGPWRQPRVHRVDERLDDGVVGGVEVVGHIERTVAGAVERLVAGRRHDPVVPADFAEVHVQGPASTQVASPSPVFPTAPRPRPPASLRVPPTTSVVFGPDRDRCCLRRRQSSKPSDEVGRRAGSVVAVCHKIRSSAVGCGRHRRSVDVSPDND